MLAFVGDVRRVEGDRRVGVCRFQAFQHVFLGELEMNSKLGHGRCPAVALGQFGSGLVERELELLQPPRHPDRPALVAEVPLDLPHDGRSRIRRELHTAPEVEPVDRLDQPDRGDLDEVVERLAAVAEPPGEVFDQREVQLDQLVADRAALGVVLGQHGELDEQRSGMRAVRDSPVGPRIGQDLAVRR